MTKSTQFKAGNPGKPKGAQNKLTRTVRETVLAVFNDLQAMPTHDLTAFAKKHPRDFYQIAAKLIPQDVSAQVVVRKLGKDLEEETYE